MNPTLNCPKCGNAAEIEPETLKKLLTPTPIGRPLGTWDALERSTQPELSAKVQPGVSIDYLIARGAAVPSLARAVLGTVGPDGSRSQEAASQAILEWLSLNGRLLLPIIQKEK